MNQQPKRQGLTYALVLGSAVTIVVGLYLTTLSNPKRFPIDAKYDLQIFLLGIAGFLLTLLGLVMFLSAVGHTANCIYPIAKRNTNLGVGIGSIFQLLSLFLYASGRKNEVVGATCFTVGTLLLIWGCIHYAQGKGYGRSTGCIGVAGLLGLMVLMALPSRNRTPLACERHQPNSTSKG